MIEPRMLRSRQVYSSCLQHGVPRWKSRTSKPGHGHSLQLLSVCRTPGTHTICIVAHRALLVVRLCILQICTWTSDKAHPLIPLSVTMRATWKPWFVIVVVSSVVPANVSATSTRDKNGYHEQSNQGFASRTVAKGSLTTRTNEVEFMVCS